jgi:hypothetical protein
LDHNGDIKRVLNNYRYISFNLGPTLMSWLKSEVPNTYRLAVEADALGARLGHGHGPALAQVFNHIIMPLANSRDKLTQIVWGKKYFAQTFGREPEGMWLAETAADTESLRLMKKNGIKFTILAQGQIDAVRPLERSRCGPWEELTSPADPRQPYRIFWGLGDDDYLDVFIYDGPVSRAVAFENLLRDGAYFFDRIEQAFGDPYPDGRPRLVNLATDGESYGHHFKYGEMALAWLCDHLERQGAQEGLILTNYGEFLSLHPPRLEARLVENTSWSCAHGVERWRSDCGCHTGGGPGWNQKWRAPLRDGLNWLRDSLSDIFEYQGSSLFKDRWAARNDYVEVLAGSYDPKVIEDFLLNHLIEPIDVNRRKLALTLMEAQLMSLYMFTSCGWFFDDIAGLEPVQNLCYALRAVELCAELNDRDLIGGLVAYLRLAKPNDQRYSGQDIWEKLVAPRALSWSLSAAHWAAARLMKVPQALEEFKCLKFTILDSIFIESTEPSDRVSAKTLAAKIEMSDERFIGLVAVKRSVLAVFGPGGSGIEFLVGSEADFEYLRALAQSGEAIVKAAEENSDRFERFSLETLWPSVRETILAELVKFFFKDLKTRTLSAFEASRELLLQYGRSQSSSDWMSRFVFRVAAEGEVESFKKTMNLCHSLDLERLGNVLDKAVSGDLFHQYEAELVDASEKYLIALFEAATAKEVREGLLTEMTAFVNFLKKRSLPVDFWRSQNLWWSLAVSESLKNQDQEIKNEPLLALGRALGFASKLYGLQ